MLSEILTWLFSESLGWILLYLAPIIAIGLGIKFLAEGNLFWGTLFILGGILIGWIAYTNRPSRQQL